MNLSKVKEKEILKFVNKMDWSGLAKAYEDAQLSWNATNWKNFVDEIRKQTRKQIIKEIEDKLVFVRERVFWKADKKIKGLDLREMYDAKKVDDIINQIKEGK